MDIFDVVNRLLSPNQQGELKQSLALLEADRREPFYQRESRAVERILFIETAGEWLDFCTRHRLDPESFCFAFLCEQGKALQIGGYQQDVSAGLLAFLAESGRDTPEIRQWLERERIDADCDEPQLFFQAISQLNRLLSAQGTRLVLWEDGLYCDCQYTLGLLDDEAAQQLASQWQSENFALILL